MDSESGSSSLGHGSPPAGDRRSTVRHALTTWPWRWIGAGWAWAALAFLLLVPSHHACIAVSATAGGQPGPGCFWTQPLLLTHPLGPALLILGVLGLSTLGLLLGRPLPLVAFAALWTIGWFCVPILYALHPVISSGLEQSGLDLYPSTYGYAWLFIPAGLAWLLAGRSAPPAAAR